MEDAVLGSVLSEITDASKELNEAADEANALIAMIEEQLVSAGVGLTVWDGVLSHESFNFQDRYDDPDQLAESEIRLGFAKVENTWGIAVKDEVYVREEEQLVLRRQYIYLLRKADRETRVLAIPELPELLQEVLKQIKARTASVKKTRGRLSK